VCSMIRVRYDLLARNSSNLTTTLSVLTLIPVRIVATIDDKAHKVALRDNTVVLYARIVLDLGTGDRHTVIRRYLCLTSRSSDGENIAVLVRINDSDEENHGLANSKKKSSDRKRKHTHTSSSNSKNTRRHHLATTAVYSMADFASFTNSPNVLVGHAWVLFDRRSSTFRLKDGQDATLGSMFECMRTYEQFLWVYSELGTDTLEVDAWVKPGDGCYVNIGCPQALSSHHKPYLIRIADPPVTWTKNDEKTSDCAQMYKYVDVCRVQIEPRSRYSHHSENVDYTPRCTGTLACTVQTSVADTRRIALKNLKPVFPC
jgi:hypothetical protein